MRERKLISFACILMVLVTVFSVSASASSHTVIIEPNGTEYYYHGTPPRQ